MNPRIFCGTFEAEAHWRDPDLAHLPALRTATSRRPAAAMDEMLFAFCNAGDYVLTARPINDAQVEYLHAIGFRFSCNRFGLWPAEDEVGDREDGSVPHLFDLMRDHRVAKELERWLPPGGRLEPFAVLLGTAEMALRYGLNGTFPSQDVICAVNTKSYSVRMRDRVGIRNVGIFVDDMASFCGRGAELLERGPFLVKDEYGVSGKGNQLIESDRGLQRISRYLAAQATTGKRIQFVLEPYLPKRLDFSCQFRVEEEGSVTLISVQELVNSGLAFAGSCAAPRSLLERLERADYFQTIREIGVRMYADGYHGDVCVDSMILENGELVPLVEINARKSMSLIKHALDTHLAKENRQGCLTYVSALNDGSSTFSALLDLMEEERLLFKPAHCAGILPVTVGTLYPKRRASSEAPTRGRLYIFVIDTTCEGRNRLVTDLRQVMKRVGLQAIH